ncbi:hypothetical protein CM15mP35_09490 [bacterium]|nr:MAG: hypothetical protein CM15mP35_09490 [bacterium]
MVHILALKKTEQGLILNRIFQVEPSISSDDIEAVNNYISSGSWITEHKLTEDLENQIKQYLDQRICCSSTQWNYCNLPFFISCRSKRKYESSCSKCNNDCDN